MLNIKFWKDYNTMQFCQTKLIERKIKVMSSYGWLQTSVTSENYKNKEKIKADKEIQLFYKIRINKQQTDNKHITLIACLTFILIYV